MYFKGKKEEDRQLEGVGGNYIDDIGFPRCRGGGGGGGAFFPVCLSIIILIFFAAPVKDMIICWNKYIFNFVTDMSSHSLVSSVSWN